MQGRVYTRPFCDKMYKSYMLQRGVQHWGYYTKRGEGSVVRKRLIMNNETGLHLRPAGMLVGEANKCESHVMLICGEHRMNCKSLMSLLAFPVCPGDEVTVECYGEDEEEALKRIVAFLENLKI